MQIYIQQADVLTREAGTNYIFLSSQLRHSNV